MGLQLDDFLRGLRAGLRDRRGTNSALLIGTSLGLVLAGVGYPLLARL